MPRITRQGPHGENVSVLGVADAAGPVKIRVEVGLSLIRVEVRLSPEARLSSDKAEAGT